MHQVTINVPDDAYLAAQERANLEGFGTTELFLSELLLSSISVEPENYDYIFTPEVIAELDSISAEIKAGAKTYSMEEVRAHLEQTRKEWLESHAS